MLHSDTARANIACGDLHERLCRARKFIDDSYHLPLDLTAISKQACLSRYHFLRLFRLGGHPKPAMPAKQP